MALWKTTGGPEREETPAAQPPIVAPRKEEARATEGATMANIGKSISIKGEVTGDEDLVVEGRVEGRIELKTGQVTIGPNGDVKAEIAAKQIVVIGRVAGNLNATERVEVRETGRVDGDLVAPRLTIQEGAQVNGAITMKPAAGGAMGALPAPAPRPLEAAKKAV
jgi:cytoskeletal protein CcmA (bactofilin family)